MVKKIICLVSSVILATSLMIGCSSKTAETPNTKNTESAASTPSTGSNDKAVQKADLEGEVTNVSGNKITVKVIKTPEAPTGDSQAAPTGDSKAAPQSSDASKDGDKSKSDAASKDGQNAKAPADVKVEYTGETKDITVGDDTKVKTMSMGQQGGTPETKDITAKDIKVGDVLQITYADKDKGTVSAINVREATSQK